MITTLTAPSIMDRLKSDTAELHKIAETRDLQKGMLKGTLPREMFADYLGQMFLIHRALEMRLGESPLNQIDRVFRDYHRRVPNLTTDLDFFGVNIDTLTPVAATRELTDRIDEIAATRPVALLGLLYVLEGSMNGNIFVARSIAKAYSLHSGPGLSYLNPYGDHARQKSAWQLFKDDMNAIDFTDTEMASILDAANLMFQSIITLSDELMEPVPA